MKVLVVDDHASVRASLKELLQGKGGFEVVGESSSGEEALAEVERVHPDVVLMDMNMPGLGGIGATRAIKTQCPDVKVMALTAFGDMGLVAEAVRAGASGYLLKGGPAEELLGSLRAVAAGHAALDPEVTKGVLNDMVSMYERELKRADALADLDEMKREFTSVVSHELRTPLTAIRGGVSTLRKGWELIDDSTKHELLDSIHGQAERLSRMIEQILTVSGIQKGGLGVNRSAFSLKTLASDAIQRVRRSWDRPISLKADRDVWVLGDRALLTDVAASLLENAIKFTAGSVEVTLSYDRDVGRIHVRDRGPGMESDQLDKLLDSPFVPGDSSNTRKVGGLGLSLYIARQVLDASGGKLEVETSPKRGSTFTMVLGRR